MKKILTISALLVAFSATSLSVSASNPVSTLLASNSISVDSNEGFSSLGGGRSKKTCMKKNGCKHSKGASRKSKSSCGH